MNGSSLLETNIFRPAALSAFFRRKPLLFPRVHSRSDDLAETLPPVDPAVRNDLVEMLAENFRTEEINELGRLVLGRFDSNSAAGVKENITLSSRKSARTLVEYCGKGRSIVSLIKLVVDLDGGIIRGRAVQVDGLDSFLFRLARMGLHYDFHDRKVVGTRNPVELANWGCLREGRNYDITVASLDCTGGARLLEQNGSRRMEKLYNALWDYCAQKLTVHGGRVWSWAGDGGVMAFCFRDHAQRAVRWALEVQISMPVFILSHCDRLPRSISLRIALDTGRIKFASDTGKIVSNVINYASHLQKKSTAPGKVSISRMIWDLLGERHRELFAKPGILEDREFLTTPGRLDTLPGMR